MNIYAQDREPDYVSVGEPSLPVYQTAPPMVADYPTGSSRQAGAETYVGPNDDAVDEMLAEGQAAMFAGQYDDAQRLFSQAMLLDDGDGRAKLLFALASLRRGEFDLAALALRRALLATPELIDNPWDLRTVFPTNEAGLPDDEAGLPDEQAYQRQVDELGRYLADYREHRGARLLLGYLYFGWGDPQRAQAEFSRLALSDPQDTLSVRLRDSAARIVRQAGW